MHMLPYYALWFIVALATAWDIRRTHRFMKASLAQIEASLARIEGTSREIHSWLGS